MRRNKEDGARIRALRGGETQADFAKRFDVTQSMISAWEAGRDIPSASIWLKLATFAKEAEDKAFFLRRAGLGEEDILSVADKIRGDRSSPPAPGESYKVPVFRETEQGTRPDGSLITVATKLVPNQGHTILLYVDEYSFGIPEMPMGAYFLDDSMSMAKDITACINHLAIMRYAAAREANAFIPGLHAGRVRVQWYESNRAPDRIRLFATLDPEWDIQGIVLPLGCYEDNEGMAGMPPGDIEGRDRRKREILERVSRDFPLDERISIVGRVVGYFPGRFGKANEVEG